MDLFIILQTVTGNLEPAAPVVQQNYLSLIMKGGWIMVPLAFLSLMAIYFIIERWLVVNKTGKMDAITQSRIMELITENKSEQALKFCYEKPYAIGKIIAAGIKEQSNPVEDIENSMQIEARMQIAKMESHMNYLGIIASIAPMLGFLGTIFGVITIFYNISQTADLDIATISDGLYQKMICSGAGLLVGIVAYSGFYIINGRIDKIVVNLDKESNEALKALKVSKRGKKSNESDQLEVLL